MKRFNDVVAAVVGLTLGAVVIVLAGGGATVKAQQSTITLEWDYVGVAPSAVSAYAQAVRFDGAAIATPPACRARTGVPTDTTCAVTIPAPASGAHTLAVTAVMNGITATTTVSGVDLGKGPAAPLNPRLTINVTINIP